VAAQNRENFEFLVNCPKEQIPLSDFYKIMCGRVPGPPSCQISLPWLFDCTLKSTKYGIFHKICPKRTILLSDFLNTKFGIGEGVLVCTLMPNFTILL